MKGVQLDRLMRRLSPSTAVVALLVTASINPVSESRSASIRLPEELARSSTRIAFTGFGGYNRGNYSGGEYHGEFTRTESRLGVFDPLYVGNRGKSSFTIENSTGRVLLAASCRMSRNSATVRFVTLDLKKMAYECDFQGSEGLVDSRLVLGEPKRVGFKEKLLARERRRGEAVISDEQLTIESMHEYEDSPLDSQTPLGYMLESSGVVVATVDLLDWNPVVHIRDGLTDTQRLAAYVVSVALAVLRDPTNSALEE
jgi:hypothetical protein